MRSFLHETIVIESQLILLGSKHNSFKSINFHARAHPIMKVMQLCLQLKTLVLNVLTTQMENMMQSELLKAL